MDPNLLPNGFTLANYRQALSDTQPIMNSVILMAVITPICLFLAVMLGHMQAAAQARWFDYYAAARHPWRGDWRGHHPCLLALASSA